MSSFTFVSSSEILSRTINQTDQTDSKFFRETAFTPVLRGPVLLALFFVARGEGLVVFLHFSVVSFPFVLSVAALFLLLVPLQLQLVHGTPQRLIFFPEFLVHCL